MSKWDDLKRELEDSVAFVTKTSHNEYTHGYAEGMRSAAYRVAVTIKKYKPKKQKWFTPAEKTPSLNHVVFVEAEAPWGGEEHVFGLGIYYGVNNNWIAQLFGKNCFGDAKVIRWRELPAYKSEDKS